ncbi:MAG: hypothetical protein AAF223_08030 [Bacteroidota bacterium]
MKYLIFGLLLIFAACSDSQTIDPESSQSTDNTTSYLDKWQLVEMSGSIANVPPTTGSEMAWQEYYLLYDDNTFTKVREQDDDTKEASGTYEFITLPDGEYLELSYPLENELIGNCTSESKELLSVQSEGKLIGTWWACDGPGLVYEKVEGQGGVTQ